MYYINPVREINKKGYNIKDVVQEEIKIYHYNNEGHRIMSEIYEEYINKYRPVQSKA
jgi:hypothetical protein